MKVIYLLAIFSLAIVATGCSSIMSGTTQNVTINSNVPGAEVMVNGNHVGNTPVTARVKRESKMHYIVTKEGYKPYQATMETKLDPWFWGNIIIGGVLGSTTDLGLGTTNKIDPDNLYVELQKDETSSSENAAPKKKKQAAPEQEQKTE